MSRWDADVLDRADRAADEVHAKVKANIARLRGDVRTERAELAEAACELREDWAPTDDESEAVGFYWWENGAFRVTILRRTLARRKRERREDYSRRQCFSLWAPTAEGLVELAAAVGWDLGDVKKVREGCDAHIHGRRQ